MNSPDDYRALRDHAGFIERTDLGRLRLRGNDRRSYLHGILTNDIQGLAAGDSCYAALLTPQGRMITDMRVYELGDETLLTLPVSMAGAIRDRLDQYIFTEDVHVEDATSATAHFAVYGPGAQELVSRISLVPPAVVVPGIDMGVAGFEIITLRAQGSEVERLLITGGAVPVDPSALDAFRIDAGIPKFLVDMTPETIPLEATIENRAISMTKGCYPGQEVIIRVLHRGGGRVARKLVGIRLGDGQPVPSAGEKIRSGDREIGSITSAARSPRLGTAVALGYVHRDFTEPGTPVVVDDAPATVSALPF